MQIHQKMDIRGTQQLMMSPRMQQSIKLLQLSLNELQGYLQEMVDENPFLQLDVPVLMGCASPHTYDQSSCIQKNKSDDDSSSDYLALLMEPQTLKKHISDQLCYIQLNAMEQKIAEVMIDSLLPSGYFTANLSELAQQLNAQEKDLVHILSLLQQCEPVGVFARTPSECFALQLKDASGLTTPLQKFLDGLDQLPHIGLKKLCHNLHISYADGERYLNIIKNLNPKPGLAFDVDDNTTSIAEIIVTQEQENRWVARLNPDAIPTLLVDMDYYDILKAAAKQDSRTQQYIKERHDHAQWLKHALAQRYVNTLKISQAILDVQSNFFAEGIKALKPMALKDIAAQVGVHESTVSRITTAKYMLTPRGTFELKFFFSSRLQRNKAVSNSFVSQFQHMNMKNDTTNQGIGVSSKVIMDKIKELIQAEDRSFPLSDEDICSLFNHHGIHVARRTIAKYRGIMNIESSNRRRFLN